MRYATMQPLLDSLQAVPAGLLVGWVVAIIVAALVLRFVLRVVKKIVGIILVLAVIGILGGGGLGLYASLFG